MTANTTTLTRSRTASFEQLARRVRTAGLLEPRRDYYAWAIVRNLVLLGAAVAAVVILGDSWWQLLVAAAFALSFVQIGFIAHDTGHHQITRERRPALLMGLLHMNMLIGVSYGWWVNHHNRHHSNPNNLDLDPDTVRRPVIFAVDELPAKATSRFRRFIIRFQAVMFFVLLGHEAFRVRSAGVRAARAALLKSPTLELGLIGGHFAAYLTLLFTAMAPLKAVAFIVVHQVLFGLYLGAVFAPNHKGMAVHRSDVELDWLHRQVLTSRNVRSNRLVDYLYGGLNYQIEHHLFPTMPRVNLRRARPMVRQYCIEHGVRYWDVSVWRSYWDVARYLAVISRQALGNRNALAGKRADEIVSHGTDEEM